MWISVNHLINKATTPQFGISWTAGVVERTVTVDGWEFRQSGRATAMKRKNKRQVGYVAVG